MIFLFDDEFISGVSYVCLKTLALLFHEVLNIDFLVSKPPKVVCHQMQRIASLTPDEYNSLFVRLLAKSACLLGAALAACISHQQQSPGSSSRAFDVVCGKGVGDL